MGQLRLRTSPLNSSKPGMLRIGSNPSEEIGGSVRGDSHSLIRPSLLASRNATSVMSPVALFLICSMNCMASLGSM